MPKKTLTIALLFVFLLLPTTVQAKWLFSSKTGRWINLKKKPKATPKLQFDYAKSLEEQGDYKKAVQEYDKFIYNFSPSPLIPEARYHLGICYENRGLYYKAFQEYKKILEEDISYENIREVIKREYQIANLFFSGKRKKILGQIPTITSPLTVAEELFENILKNAPYSEYAVKSLFRIGEIKKKKKKYKEAIEKFTKVITEYNNPEYKEASSLEIALCKYLLSKGALYDQERTIGAVKNFKAFIKEYPDSSKLEKAKEKLKELQQRHADSLYEKAVFYEKQGKYDSALVYYEKLSKDFADSEISKQAAQKITELTKKEEPENKENQEVIPG